MTGMMLAAALAMNPTGPTIEGGSIVFFVANGRVIMRGSNFEASADRIKMGEEKTTLELEGSESDPAAVWQVDPQTRARMKVIKGRQIHFHDSFKKD